MPFINVKITKGGVSRAQKQQIVREMTDTLVRVLGKKPEHTHIVIEEVPLDNWGFMGELTSVLRKKRAK